MRTTLLNQFYVPDISPTAHLTASLAEHLSARGYDVTVVTSRGGYVKQDAGPDDQREEDPGHPRVLRIWTPRLGKSTIIKRCIDYGLFYLGALWRLLTLPRQDVIISLTTPPYIAWAALAHKMLHPSAKVVLWSMDCYPDAAERLGVMKSGGLLSRVMRMMNRAMFARLDHLISLDTAMQELLLSQYGPRHRALPACIIPNWEKASFFPPPDVAKPNAWRRSAELGLEGRFVVLYLGNMGYGHEFDTILEAAEILRDEDVAFLFVGGGRRWSELDRAARERDLRNIIMHDYVPKEETLPVMACADCALITLRDESLGVMSPSKLHSNLAMALPVLYIGPRGSNVDDAIARFSCGESIRIGEVERVVEFIRANLQRDERHRDLRARARRAFDEAYTDEVTLPQFERIIEQLTCVHTPRSHGLGAEGATHA